MKYLLFIILTAFISCNSGSNNPDSTVTNAKPKNIVVPAFNSDSAFQFVAKQVEFGPRVPNTEAHLLCAEYLKHKLESFGSEVIVQEAQVIAFDDKILNAT